jgi:uncharacterized protein involved in exopolysaccharide biosynthesis
MPTSLTPRAHVPGPELLADPDAFPPRVGARTPASILGVLRRHWLLIAVCTITAIAVAAALVRRSVPVYQASATLRLDDQQSRLQQVVESRGAAITQLPTEIEELRSRSLIEDVARELRLQFRVTAPHRVRRSELFADIEVAEGAEPASYELRW